MRPRPAAAGRGRCYTYCMIETALIFGLFGLIIGSFLNVLILRHGIKTILGRSGCLSCRHELQAIDLVPVVSWLALGGRCRYCGSRISLQYPLVELSTALLFAAIGAAPIALALQILALPIAALLVAITAYDLRHTIIPDAWVILFSLFSILFSIFYLYSIGQIASWLPIALSGPLFALPFAALWLVSGGRWIGLGDGKLAWGIGWLLGPLYAYVAIVLAFIGGALVALLFLLPLSSKNVWLVLKRITPKRFSAGSRWGFTMKSEVAFGPFLAIACLIVWISILYHFDIAKLMHLA